MATVHREQEGNVNGDSEPIFDGTEPRKAHGGRDSWAARLRPFMDRPGEWGYLIQNRPAQKAGQLRSRRLGQLLGRWEFSGDETQGEPRLYVRYLGPETNGDHG